MNAQQTDTTSLTTFVSQHLAQISANTQPTNSTTHAKHYRSDPLLDRFIRLHITHVRSSDVKVVDYPEDFTPEQIETAFKQARKEQLLGLLEYGIDILAPLCLGSPEGKEHWLMDFYGMNQPIARDLLMADKETILKAYRKSKWKIALVGGSVAHWNRRRHFVAFLERFVIYSKKHGNGKNVVIGMNSVNNVNSVNMSNELCDKAKDLLSIVIVQSAIMSYL